MGGRGDPAGPGHGGGHVVSWEADLADLVRERGSALVGHAFLLCGDRREAEDLVQDALVKVFAGRRRGVDNLEGYVRAAVLSTYLDRYRRRRRWAGLRHLVGQPERLVAPDEAAVEREDLTVALRALPPRERACVVLRFYEDLTVAQIAEVLSLAPGSVKRYLSDGIRRLEDTLGPLPASRGSLAEEELTVDVRGSR